MKDFVDAVFISSVKLGTTCIQVNINHNFLYILKLIFFI